MFTALFGMLFLYGLFILMCVAIAIIVIMYSIIFIRDIVAYSKAKKSGNSEPGSTGSISSQGTIDVSDFDVIENDADESESSIYEKDDNIYEPYICPECFEPYDGIYCENCGHSNDEIGYEEESEEDKRFEGMAAMVIFDAMDKASNDEKNDSLFGIGFDGDDYDEDDF